MKRYQKWMLTLLVGFCMILLPTLSPATEIEYDPCIRFLVPETTGTTELNDLSELTRTGNFTEQFHNNTGMTFTDFHFIITWMELGVPRAKGYGTPYFEDVQYDESGSSMQYQHVDFYLGATGTGIPHCTNFIIEASGFPENTIIRFVPSVPEPGTISLMLLGIVGLGIAGVRRVLKRK